MMMRKHNTDPRLLDITNRIVIAVCTAESKTGKAKTEKLREVKELCDQLKEIAIKHGKRKRGDDINEPLDKTNELICYCIARSLQKNILRTSTYLPRPSFLATFKDYSLASALRDADSSRIQWILKMLDKFIAILNSSFPDTPFFFTKERKLMISDFLQQKLVNENGIEWSPIYYALAILQQDPKKTELISVLSTFFRRIATDLQAQQDEEKHAESKTENIVTPRIWSGFYQKINGMYNSPLNYLFPLLENYSDNSQEHAKIKNLINDVVEINPSILELNMNVIVDLILKNRLDDLDFYLELMNKHKCQFEAKQLEYIISYGCDRISDASKVYDLFEERDILLYNYRKITPPSPLSQLSAVTSKGVEKKESKDKDALEQLPPTLVEPFVPVPESPRNKKS